MVDKSKKVVLGYTNNGIPVALEGHTTSCGVKLIASTGEGLDRDFHHCGCDSPEPSPLQARAKFFRRRHFSRKTLVIAPRGA